MMRDTLETYSNPADSDSSYRNSKVFITTSVDRLYRSEAFQQGYEDYRRGLPFDYPKRCKGPNPSRKSAELAYETGRQFAAWLGPNFYRSDLICLRSKFSEAIQSRSIIL